MNPSTRGTMVVPGIYVPEIVDLCALALVVADLLVVVEIWLLTLHLEFRLEFR